MLPILLYSNISRLSVTNNMASRWRLPLTCGQLDASNDHRAISPTLPAPTSPDGRSRRLTEARSGEVTHRSRPRNNSRPALPILTSPDGSSRELAEAGSDELTLQGQQRSRPPLPRAVRMEAAEGRRGQVRRGGVTAGSSRRPRCQGVSLGRPAVPGRTPPLPHPVSRPPS